jgi:hypothetical protein
MKILKLASAALLPAALLLLAGCWTPPNANVQPKGQPGLIQDRIAVESIKEPATVQSVDAAARTLTLKFSNHTRATYKVGAQVKNFAQVQTGSQVEVAVNEELAVYLLVNGRLPDGTTAETLGVNARVLLADPGYRLLTLQYPDGQNEVFKPGPGTRLEQMAPGDSVVVRPGEVTSIHIGKP